MSVVMNKLSVLEFLERHISNSLSEQDTTHMEYPTRISQTLGIRVIEAGSGTATVEIDADTAIHGNQQGTVHGGLISELADAAIGTAHSTLMGEGETFASLDLRVNFFRPVWKSTLRAIARPVQSGRAVSHYTCEIIRDDGKVIAIAASAVMTLRGAQAAGR